MFKILISSKLSRLIGNRVASKIAADWEDRYVYHTTPTGHRTKIQIKNLPPEEKEKYRPFQFKQRQFNMTVPEIQESVAKYQKTGSAVEFKKLFTNFLPVIKSAVTRIINKHPGFSWSKHDVEDLRSAADIIFAKTVGNADANNKGIVQYIYTTIAKQLTGKAREIFEPHHVNIESKDRRLLREVKKYLYKHQGQKIDYDTMAREINADPESKVTHATPELINDLLSSGKMSLDQPVAKDESDATMHDILGVEGISKDVSFDPSVEEQRIKEKMKKIIQDSVNAIEDPMQRKILQMRYGLTDEYGSTEMNPLEIARELGKNRSYVRRQLAAAESALRRMDEIKKLKRGSSVLRIIKAFNKHIRFVYEPTTVVKVAANIVNIDDFVVTKYSNQLVCSCGKDCYHKDVASKYFQVKKDA